MLNIQDFIDAGACLDGVLEIVESTGRIQLSVDVLLRVNKKWTEQCLSGYGTYGHSYGIRAGSGYGTGYGYGNRSGDGQGYGSVYGY